MVLAHIGDAARDPLDFHLHPDVVAVVAAVALAYWLALRIVGPRVVPPEEPVLTRRQARMLVAAVAGLWIASDWPLHDLGEGYLYSAHMVQHSLYTVVLPPLFILARPPGCGAGSCVRSCPPSGCWSTRRWPWPCSAR